MRTTGSGRSSCLITRQIAFSSTRTPTTRLTRREEEEGDQSDEVGGRQFDEGLDAGGDEVQEVPGPRAESEGEEGGPLAVPGGEVALEEVAALAMSMENVNPSDVTKLKKSELLFHLRARGLPAAVNKKRGERHRDTASRVF
mmetsp:Transcript_10730/g.13397  ORF Transcript_10730/g.13397 Transcript_10730/m.13397 type:complete len:142 (-) Transcript_10730:28-453(-)